MNLRWKLLFAALAVVALVGAGALWWWTQVGPRLDAACEGVRPAEGFELSSNLPPGATRPRTSGQSADVIARLRHAAGPRSGDAVFCGDFADPDVLWTGRFYYAYATSTRRQNVPVIRSIDLVHGHEVGDALPKLPAWTEPGRVWAPSVVKHDGQFLLFYSTHDSASGLQCISRAVATNPEGPFTDSSKQPMICPTSLGGAIDPSAFVGNDGALFLLWKNDGNSIGVPNRLWSQRLSDDGLAVAGDPHEILTADQPWEGGIVEAPSMVEHDETLYLFYSANRYNTADYAIGYATCDTVAGPCSKPNDGPWLGGTEHAQGPGGEAVFRGDGNDLWIVFHAWISGEIGYPKGVRSLFVARLTFVDGVPVTVT